MHFGGVLIVLHFARETEQTA